MIFVTQEDPTQDWSPSKLTSNNPQRMQESQPSLQPLGGGCQGGRPKLCRTVVTFSYALLRRLRQPLNTSLMALSVRRMVLAVSWA